MDDTSSDSKASPWSNLKTLLRNGPAAIETADPDLPTLLDIINENHRLFNAMVEAFYGMIYICSWVK